MTVASTNTAEYLKAADRFTSAIDATTQTRWAEDAQDTTQVSALAVEADAITEAARQLAFLKLPTAIDIVTLEGLFYDLEGVTISVPYDGRLGIAGSALFLVIHPRLDLATGTTVLEGIVLL